MKPVFANMRARWFLNTGMERNSGETILEVSFKYFGVYIFRRRHFQNFFDRAKMGHGKSETVRIENSEPFEWSSPSSVFQNPNVRRI